MISLMIKGMKLSFLRDALWEVSMRNELTLGVKENSACM